MNSSTELRRRPSGVPGLVVMDVPKGSTVRAGKYWLMQESTGGLLTYAQFRTVRDAKAAAQAMAEAVPDRDWSEPFPVGMMGSDRAADKQARKDARQAEAIILQHWRAQR